MAGVLVNLIIYIPLFLLQSVLVFLFFIDNIIAGDFLGAFKQFILSPIKIVKMLFNSITLVITSGWGTGLTGLFDVSFQRIKTYWIDFYNTDANYFSSVFYSSHLDFYQGKYIGAFAHKISLLFFATFYFDLYKNYNHCPHNPVVTLTANQLYDLIDMQYGEYTKNNLSNIYNEIKTFLESQTPETQSDATFALALKSLNQMKTGFTINAHDLKISAQHNLLKTPINTLSLVWTVIHSQAVSNQKKWELRKFLATYMANLQRNLSASTNSPDLEECGTGYINTFLEFLKVVNPLQYSIQLSQTESWSVMKTLLNERLNQKYYVKENAMVMAKELLKKNLTQPTTVQLNADPEKEKQNFITSHRLSLHYYARFLNNTPQGQALTGLAHLDDAGVDTTSEEVLNNWMTPQ